MAREPRMRTVDFSKEGSEAEDKAWEELRVCWTGQWTSQSSRGFTGLVVTVQGPFCPILGHLLF